MSGIMQLHQLQQMERMRGQEPFQEPIPFGGRTEGLSREQMGWGVGGLATGLAPGAGLADAFGYLPDPFAVGEYYPSMTENIRQGQWADVGMQALGLGADALTAIGPPGIAAGTVIRGARTANRAEAFRPSAEMETAYMRAIDSGDEAAAQRIFDDALEQSGRQVFEAPDTVAYSVRRADPPRLLVPRFKAFRYTEKGLTPLYVGASDVLPMNTWLDAREGGFHFLDRQGNARVPARTGDSAKIDPETAAQLYARGFVSDPDVTTVKSVAFRPGWHTGSLPYNPQGGGPRDRQWSKEQGIGNTAHPYPHLLGRDIVIGQVSLPGDQAERWARVYEQTAVRNRNGSINTARSGVREVPVDGYYNYTTNPNNRLQPGDWSIGGSMRIERLLPNEEADALMRASGFPPQRRVEGSVDPANLDLRPFDYSDRVLGGAVLRDGSGRALTLSERLNPPSVWSPLQADLDDLREALKNL